MFDKILLMTGFELWISGVGGDRSTKCATNTALKQHNFILGITYIKACFGF